MHLLFKLMLFSFLNTAVHRIDRDEVMHLFVAMGHNLIVRLIQPRSVRTSQALIVIRVLWGPRASV